MDGRFLHDDFLLSSETARALFHEVAERLPIVDLHNHLPPGDVAGNRVYANLAELWLEDDHYKWRAMRLAGVEERLVTGEADPWERFSAWAATVPGLVRNPLYVWTHLELRRVFGIDLPLGPGTAPEIWEEANRLLPNLSARTLLERFAVAVIATTDDPGDDLTSHRLLREERDPLRMIPTFRPDAAHRLLGDPPAWNAWADRLGTASGIPVDDLASLLAALAEAHGRFAALGGRASDHGLSFLPDADRDSPLADTAVRRARSGAPAGAAEQEAVLLEVVTLAARLAIADEGVLQLHLGALRNLSPRILEQVGRDAGADAADDRRQAPGLARWFNDHEGGLRRALDDLSRIGRLAGFVGMVTDSRSLLSMTRHELFRRILCDTIGRDVEGGLIPADHDQLSTLVRDVCLDNVVRWFRL